MLLSNLNSKISVFYFLIKVVSKKINLYAEKTILKNQSSAFPQFNGINVHCQFYILVEDKAVLSDPVCLFSFHILLVIKFHA